MWLSDTSVRRPVLATVLSALLVAFGLLSFRTLPLRELPDVDPPVVSVITEYRGASASVVENRVTREIEDRLAGIEGIRTIEAKSREGVSEITVEFELSRDIEDATNDVRDRVSQSMDDIPKEAEPPQIFKAESDAHPIMWLQLHGDGLDTLALTDYAERRLVDRISVVNGVARVVLSGAKHYSMRIWLDRIALASRQLTVADVAAALRAENVEIPAGRLESRERDITLRLERGYRTPEDFEALVVGRGGDGHLIRLGELARVEVAALENRGEFRGNGVPRVGVGVIKQSTANTVRVARAVVDEVERIQPSLPPGMHLTVTWDSSLFVQASVDQVYFTLAIAMLLVIGVIYLFLGTRRAAVIPAITVPICLISTFTALYAFGLSINLLTLLALILSIGLVVDDSIVVLENVQRRIDLGERPLLAAYRGTREVGFAVIATTLVVIAVFVPIVFLEGITGRFFRELALTVSAAVAISSFVALSLSAMLCSKLLVSKEREQGLSRTSHRIVDRLQANYMRLLEPCLRRPWLPMLVVLAAVWGIAQLMQTVPQELEPPEDRGGFMIFMQAPEGGSFDYSQRHMRQLEDDVLFPMVERGEVSSVLSRVPGGYSEGGAMNSGMVIMVLELWNKRSESLHSLMNEVSRKGNQIPGVLVFPIAFGGLGQSRSAQPVQLVIGGANHEEVGAWQEEVLAAVTNEASLVGVQGDYRPTQPQLRVEVDRSRAADMGVAVESIGRTLETMIGSSRITTYEERGEEYEVVVQGEPLQRASPTDLSNLYVRSTTTGDLIPLANLVSFREVADAGSLRRFNRLPAATVSANLAPGATLGEGLANLERLAREVLPNSAHFDYKGNSREFVESTGAGYFSFALALLIVFLVLAAQFESFLHPLVILLSVPLAVVGALVGLQLSGGSLNVYSQIGMTILIGLSAKNGILIVEFANRLRAQGKDFDEAVREAARTRMRPILMTGISTALGALPLVLGTGPGSGGRQAIGVVVFAGVIFATFLTLFVVPVAYSLLGRRTQAPDTIAKRLESYEAEAQRAGA